MDEYITRNNVISAVCFGCNQEFSDEPCEPDACAIRKSIMALPTADVVPKSEVESIITLNSQLEAQVFEQRKEIERLKKYNTDVAFKHYNDGKAELASKIFAEIETLLALNILVGDVFTGKYFDADLENDLAELKKKYTEGKPLPAPEEKYFSPQDVRKMTPKEVHENYTAIRRSMDKWN